MHQTPSVPRLRTIPQAFEVIKQQDPNTALTLRALHRMVDNAEIPTIPIGSKKLIDLDLLFEHLSCYNERVFCVSEP